MNLKSMNENGKLVYWIIILGIRENVSNFNCKLKKNY